MLVVSIDYVPDKEFIVLGIVQGCTLYSSITTKDHSKPLAESLETYTQVIDQARQDSTSLMIQEAESLDADAIINVRYATSAIAVDTYESLVYGTAVKFKIQHTLGQF